MAEDGVRDEPPDGLERALDRAQADVDAALRAAAGVTRELRRARSAAVSGSVRDLRRSLEAVSGQARELAEQVADARAGYDIDEREWLASGSYAKELLAAAEAAGVAMFEEDERLLCYPSLVRVLPGDLALEIDRRRRRGLRPSAVVAALQRAQQSGPRFRAEPFLASLAAGYDLVCAQQGKAGGAVVRLVDVYAVLTLLPGTARDYTKPEFARDLYLLDQDGTSTLAGPGGTRRRIRWAASTGTRQPGVLVTVTRSGQQQRYWGVAFEEVPS